MMPGPMELLILGAILLFVLGIPLAIGALIVLVVMQAKRKDGER